MVTKYRSLFGIGALALLLFVAWALYTPIPFTELKIAMIVSALVLFGGVGYLFKWGKWLAPAVVVPLVLCALWPSSPPASGQLRGRYLTALSSYIGTPYVWGGENGRGIDCSGLIRRAMIDALLAQGWHDRNPSLWRSAALIWWKDCSASAMKDGYDGQIEPLFAARSLNGLDMTRLQIGDLAVTGAGVHVLAFIGGKTWIQADPNLANGGDKVILTTAPSKSGWFGQGVRICRWRNLS